MLQERKTLQLDFTLIVLQIPLKLGTRAQAYICTATVTTKARSNTLNKVKISYSLVKVNQKLKLNI